MADPVDILPISNSYVGLLRISNDATGASGTPMSVYTSDGKETALSLGTDSATISGALNATSISANTIETTSFAVTGEVIFTNTVSFSKVDETAGAVVDAGVIFENKGTFKSTGSILSEGTADFTDLNCSATAIFGSAVTITDIASFNSDSISFTKDFSCSGDTSFTNVKLNKISVASGSGITVESPITFTGTVSITNNIGLSGSNFVVNTLNTKFNKVVTFAGTAALGSKATATTQAAGDNSTKVATTAYVDRAIGSGGSIPDYSNGTSFSAGTYTCPANGLFLLHVPGRSNGEFYINGTQLCYWNHHYNYTEPSWTSFIVAQNDKLKLTGAASGKLFPFK